VDLSYDACGDLWASYHYGGLNKPSVGIAYWDQVTSSWSQRQADRNSKPWSTSAAADPLATCGPPAITYGVDSGNQGQLRIVESESAPVVVDSGPKVTSAIGVGSFSSLAYKNGGPTAAYSYIDDAGCYMVKYAERDTTRWNSEVVTTYGRGPWDVSLAHQEEMPVLVFSDSRGNLHFCERSNEWVCGPMPSVLGSFPSILVDEQNTVVVSAERWGHVVYSRAPGASEWHAERTGAASSGDSAIDPSGNPAFCYRQGLEVHFVYKDTGGCESAADCNDLNPCTIDSCDASGTCTHDFLPDGEPCDASGSCCNGQCTIPICSSDIDCDDGDPCTDDSCVFADFPCDSYCQHADIPGCGGGDCLEKGEPCTSGDECCSGLCHPVKGTCK
jgi:hypothetical protein